MWEDQGTGPNPEVWVGDGLVIVSENYRPRRFMAGTGTNVEEVLSV